MDQSDFDRPRNDPRAQRVIRSIERFATEFDRRVPREHANEVLYDSVPLEGGIIRQGPERFIEEHLIRDVADALGYQYRPQPKGFEGLGDDTPDFTITNVDVTVVGELKSPNGIKKAQTESIHYLDEAENRPLVGIASDGWTWIKYTARKGEKPTPSDHCSLRQVIRDIAREQSVDQSPRRDRPELRKRCYDFVSSFGAEEIGKSVESEQD
ncbi:hypothetical protein EXE46_10410 [Halorubrum sp. GN11_10-6_MGM]|uniref:hypothetical protein n=1 Tax=Halorubrum sp. GN11_10-6_MGM TaxID=2518112 RepID=UPI0010F5F047|nr:hypothetical protein [Halorubrum sp. GN11_10-6_MGM]TKX74246.1 hypothetical protein EXE46_10410 [Halorubrum sp. GN11_10-6_MGM]